MNIFNFILSFIEGILTFISPCILPLLPVYFIYLAGSSGKGGEHYKENRGRLLVNAIGFVIGFSIVFVALGATATSLGSFLKSNSDMLRKISGTIMIVFGLNFMGIFKLSFLDFEKRMEVQLKNLRLFSSILFGVVFGFGWTPCVGQFLMSALLMAGNSETLTEGMLLLLAYSMGLGLPFILSAVMFEKAGEAFGHLKKYSRLINIISGIVLIAVGILFITGYINYLGLLSW